MPSSPQAETAQQSAKHNVAEVWPEDHLQHLTDALFRVAQRAIFRRMDRLFAWLLVIQLGATFAVALAGPSPLRLDPATAAVVFLNALVASLPIILAFVRPGAEATRHAVAAAQMVTSAVLVYVTKGPIDVHFHMMISLAFLALYRDWRVLGTASTVGVCDYLMRVLFAPASLFGTAAVVQWRMFESGAWILLANVFLVHSCVRTVREMKADAERYARLAVANAALCRKVEERQTVARLQVAAHCEMRSSRLDSRSRLELALHVARHGSER
jgi:hypothetical protein